MNPLANESLVMGADLRNEVRGLRGTMHWSSWAAAAERAGERLLAINTYCLMFAEGLPSANGLSGVRGRPVRLKTQPSSLPGARPQPVRLGRTAPLFQKQL